MARASARVGAFFDVIARCDNAYLQNGWEQVDGANVFGGGVRAGVEAELLKLCPGVDPAPDSGEVVGDAIDAGPAMRRAERLRGARHTSSYGTSGPWSLTRRTTSLSTTPHVFLPRPTCSPRERASPCCGTLIAMNPTKPPPPEDAPLGPGDLARLRARDSWGSWDESDLDDELAPWLASSPDPERPPSGTAS